MILLRRMIAQKVAVDKWQDYPPRIVEGVDVNNKFTILIISKSKKHDGSIRMDA
jgi:hypothetical protein